MSEQARIAIWLGLALVAFVGIGIAAHTGAEFDFTRDHSSLRANPWGTKAWRELLEYSGLRTETWTQPLSELTPDQRCLVLLDPVLPVRAEERSALIEWVQAGGRLIVAPHAYRGDVPAGRAASESIDQLLAAFYLHSRGGYPEGVEVARAVDDPLTEDAKSIYVPTGQRLQSLSLPMTTIRETIPFGEGDAAVVLRLEVGAGTVIALCEAGMLDNATLRRADNAILAANLVFAGETPGVVYFDEYHHGFAEAEHVYAGPEVDVAPVRNTALALIGIAAIYALGRSRRFGAPRAARARGRSGDEYVRAFAEVYSRADAAGAATRMLADGLRLRASRAAGVPAAVANSVLQTALERRGMPGQEITQLLDELEAAERRAPGERELVGVAQRVTRYERMF